MRVANPFPKLVRDRGKPPRRVAVLSDFHAPHHDKRACDVACTIVSKYNPDLLIINGDLFDFYSLSRFKKIPKRLRTEAVADEAERGAPLVSALDGLAPRVIYLPGNHEARWESFVADNPAIDGVATIKGICKLPARWECHPAQAILEISHLLYFHGDLPGMPKTSTHPAMTLGNRLRRTCVFGHYHRSSRYEDRDWIAVGASHLAGPVASQEYRAVQDSPPGFVLVDYAGPGIVGIESVSVEKSRFAVWRGSVYRAR